MGMVALHAEAVKDLPKFHLYEQLETAEDWWLLYQR